MKIITTPYPKYRKAEVVERKAIGHPDSLADGISEAVSRALSREYRKEHGMIHHHNVDKVGIVAGQSRTAWGGGEIVKPIRVIIAGRAHYSIPVQTIAIRAARDYLREVLPLARDEHFIIDPMIGEGASELVGTVGSVVSNDTSVGVGFAPLSETEQTTLDIADFLTGKSFSKEWPEVGQDIKVMSHQSNGNLDVTIALAFVDKYLKSLDDYKSRKGVILETLQEKFRKASIQINTLDDYGSKDSLFLTVVGTSAEQGDDGATGRGNRINGLITPARPMSLEAACGKNPVCHVGKLYNVLAQKIADRLYAETKKPAEVIIQSRIGKPITDPPLVLVRTDADGINASVKDEVEKLPGITDEFVMGKVRLF
jgi:S-adenosylmethionine synthetase